MKIKFDTEKEIYQVYVARCLRVLTENTAKIGGGNYIKKDYYELINPKPTDKRTAEEIVQDVSKKAGIEVI